MSVRRASVDVTPRHQSTEPGSNYHVYENIKFSTSNHHSFRSHKSIPVPALIQTLMDCGSSSGGESSNSSSSNNLENVSSMVDLIFVHVADNTSFSEKTLTDNLKSIVKHLESTREFRADLCKRQMLHSMQTGNVNVYTIRKLISVNGFDIESEIGPIPEEEGQNSRTQAPKSHTVLTWASWKGNLSLVKCLIDEGANPNTFTAEELAAIHCSSMNDESLPVLKYFLEHPRLEIDVDFCSSELGVTPLMQACLFGAYNAVEYLLEQKAQVNYQDCEGKSPIFYAVRNGHLNVVKLLVIYGAVVCLRDNERSTLLHHLIKAHKRKHVSMSTLTDILVYLVEEKGLHITNRSISGSTALHEACRRGFTEVAKFLLEKGACLEAKEDGWKTPLWSAVTGKFPSQKLIMLLLEKGANFDAQNGVGMTVIQYTRLILKDEALTAVLEEAQKILRTNRMKAMYAKRRAILASGNTFGGGFMGSFRDYRERSYSRIREATPMIGWTGTQVKTEQKMDFVKKESVEDAYRVCGGDSVFCGDEVPILKIEQNYDGNEQFKCEEETYKCKYIKAEDKDEGMQDDRSVSGEMERFSQVSLEVDNKDNGSSKIEDNNNELVFGDKEKALLAQEHPFERLVRKKKIEMMEGKGENEKERHLFSSTDEEENDDEVVMPQKIKKMRRCSVIVSDDSD